MIKLQLSDDLNPNLIYDKLYERYTLNRTNGSLKVQTFVPESGRYMLCVKYNSVTTPTIQLKLNGKLIDNNCCRNKTGSLDYIISVTYKNGPFNVNKGNNLFEFICSGKFPEIYEMYLEPYTPLPPVVYQYNPSDFVVIRNFNVYGGFYWNLNNILVGLTVCDMYRKIPIIVMDTGFYINNSDLEPTLIKFCDNWFSYFFEDPVKIPGSLYRYLTLTKKKVTCNKASLTHPNVKDFVLAYTRETFNMFSKVDKKQEMLNKYLKLHPNIENYISEIKDKVFVQNIPNAKYIGIHYRGTDKIAEKNTPEEFPIHYEYDKIYDILNKRKNVLEFKRGKKVYFVVSTDEKPFLDHMIRRFGDRVLYYKEGFRSELSTSGMKENFENIVPRNRKIDTSSLDEEERNKYELRDTLVNSSLHIGYKDKSNYRKALDCLIDAMILDRCDILYKSKGNFSLFCKWFNKSPNLEVHDLNEIYEKKTRS